MNTVLSSLLEQFKREVEAFTSGKLHGEKFKRYRINLGVYAQRQPGFYLIRTRIPAGRLTAKQLSVISQVARRYGRSITHVTTRQDIQIHWLKISDVVPALYELAEAEVTSLEAGGNAVRNVTTCHLAGICPDEIFDVSEASWRTTTFLVNSGYGGNLPRKFKIAFSGCSKDCAYARVNDVGLIACTHEGKRGFRVYLAGGLGAHPRMAHIFKEFLPEAEVTKFTASVLAFFNEFGERRNRARARMKFLALKWGEKEFNNRVSQWLQNHKIETSVHLPLNFIQEEPRTSAVENEHIELKDQNEFLQWEKARVTPQKQEGYFAVEIRKPYGIFTSEELDVIAELAQRFNGGFLRTTLRQSFLIPWIEKNALYPLFFELKKANLVDTTVEAETVTCPGIYSCRLAITNTRALASELNKELDNLDGLDIRISGCPSSCGQHQIAGIGLYGAARKHHGDYAPYYMILLGGTPSGDVPSAAKPLLRIPARNIPRAVKRLVETFFKERRNTENFSEYIGRVGTHRFEEMLSDLLEVPPFEQAPEYYYDFGIDRKFSLEEIGPGECAGSMVDLMEVNLRDAKKIINSVKENIFNIDEEIFRKRAISAAAACARSVLILFGTDPVDDAEAVQTFEKELYQRHLLPKDFKNLHKNLTKEKRENVLKLLELLYKRCQHVFDVLDPEVKIDFGKDVELIGDNSSTGEASVAAELLDLSGTPCPLNYVKTKLKLEELPPGAMLEVILDDGEPIENVPRSLQNDGVPVLKKEQRPDGRWKITVKKK